VFLGLVLVLTTFGAMAVLVFGPRPRPDHGILFSALLFAGALLMTPKGVKESSFTLGDGLLLGLWAMLIAISCIHGDLYWRLGNLIFLGVTLAGVSTHAFFLLGLAHNTKTDPSGQRMEPPAFIHPPRFQLGEADNGSTPSGT